MTSYPFSVVQARWYQRLMLLIGLLIIAGGALQAVPPSAPSNLRVKMSVIRTPAVGNSPTYRHEYIWEWNDNSNNEDGFVIDYSIGAGSWFALFNKDAGVTSDDLPLGSSFGTDSLPAGTTVNFRVRSFKSFISPEYSTDSNVASVVLPNLATAGLDFDPPTNAAVAIKQGSRGEIGVLSWTDNSQCEAIWVIEYRASGTTTWQTYRLWYHSLTDIEITPISGYTNVRLTPGQAYDFRVRARRGAGTTGDPFSYADSETASYTMPLMNAPTDLVATAISETTMKLDWVDNSEVELGFAYEYQIVGDTVWNLFNFSNANVTTATINVGPNVSLRWRVRTVFQDTQGNNTYSVDSNYATVSTVFSRPTNFIFTNIGTDSVSFSWVDNSVIETGYEILARATGTSQWGILTTTSANSRTASFNNLSASTGFSVDKAVDFALRAVKTNTPVPPATTAVSDYSQISDAITRERFISILRGDQNGGVRFEVTTSNPANRTLTLSDPPPGVSLNTSVTPAVVSGTPTTPGVYICPITATWTDGQTQTRNISIRVAPPIGGAPTLVSSFPNKIIPLVTVPIPVSGKFNDADTEQAVRINTTLGNIDVALYASLTPLTVANFLAYANAGDYNGVAFHRAIPGFILQGGGFKPTSAPDNYSVVTPRPSPLNEPGLSNLTGTIAMAKIGGQPNSATHDFFFNVANNNSLDPDSLDNQNGGFTVFGRVLGNGMTTVNTLINKPQLPDTVTGTDTDQSYSINAGASTGLYKNWPMNVSGVNDLPAAPTMDNTKNLLINSVTSIPTITYSAASTNSAVATVAMTGGVPQVTGVANGTAEIVISATDLDGLTTNTSFEVTVDSSYVSPSISTHPANVSVNYNGEATFSVVAAGSNLTYQWKKGANNIPGATNASYTINQVLLSDVGSYSVVVGNSADSITSNAATLTVLYDPPSLDTPPAGASIVYGNPVTFSVVASGGSPLTYQWKKAGNPISGAVSASYTIPNVVPADAGNYTVTVSNLLTSVTSPPATLTVQYVNAGISTHPQSASVQLGGNLTLSVVATGDGPLTYQWRKNATPIDGATSSSFSIANAIFGNSGSYTVAVTNLTGTVISEAAVVMVQSPPSIITEPVSLTRNYGASASFSIEAEGTGPLSYQWKKGTSDISGATNASFTIDSVVIQDAGSYSVTVSNTLGTVTSASVTLTVNAVDTDGDGLTDDVELADTPPTAIDDADSDDDGYSDAIEAFFGSIGAGIGGAASKPIGVFVANNSASGTPNAMSVLNVPLAMQRIPAGSFTSVAAGNVPFSIGAFWLGTFEISNRQFAAVLQRAKELGFITVSGTGRRTVTYEGQTVCQLATHLGSEAGSIGPAVSEVDLDIYNQSFYVADDGSINSVANHPVRGITYYGTHLVSRILNAVHGYPRKNTAGFGYDVNADGYYLPRDEEWEWAARGGSAALAFPTGSSVTATQANFTPGPGKTMPVTSFAASRLGLFNLAGNVSEWVFNSDPDLTFLRGGGWADTQNALRNVARAVTEKNSLAAKAGLRLALKDNRPPSITTQPQPVLVYKGSPVSFSVVASGAPPLRYQWFKGSTAIVGATSSTLSFPTAQMTDGADYKVEISNGLGKLSSAIASATVVNGERTTYFAGLSAPPGVPTVQTLIPAPISGTNGVSYRWKRVTYSGTPPVPEYSNFAERDYWYGITGNTLFVKNTVSFDFIPREYNFQFACSITKAGVAEPLLSGIAHYQILLGPILNDYQNNPPVDPGIVGGAYCEKFPVLNNPERLAQTVSATGLPKGLDVRLVTDSGGQQFVELFGSPTEPGDKTIRISARSVGGQSNTLTITMFIDAPPSNMIGKWVGIIQRSSPVNGNYGARLDIDTTSAASFSGKLYVGGATHSVSGPLVTTDSGAAYSGRAVIARPGTSSLQLDFVLRTTGVSTRSTMTGTLGVFTPPSTVLTATTPLSGWRNTFALTSNATQVGLHNVSLDLDTADKGTTMTPQLSKPQGMSFGALTIDAKGNTTLVATMADATVFTCKGILGPSGQVPVWAMLYTNKGSVVGGLSVATNAGRTVSALASSPLSWLKELQPSTVNTYRTGFGPLTLTPAGGLYLAPSATPPPSRRLVMGLADPAVPNNAKISLTQVGVTDSPTWAATPGMADTIFSVSNTNIATFGATNPGKIALTFTATTGDFKGSFTILNPAPSTLTRRVSFVGKIIPGTNHGWGYFTLPALPGITPPAVLSGRVQLLPNP